MAQKLMRIGEESSWINSSRDSLFFAFVLGELLDLNTPTLELIGKLEGEPLSVFSESNLAFGYWDITGTRSNTQKKPTISKIPRKVEKVDLLWVKMN